MKFRWQLFVDPAAHEAVTATAESLGITPGEFVRRAIDQALAVQRAAMAGDNSTGGNSAPSKLGTLERGLADSERAA